MVPWPLYCASLALSLSPGGNAPADTTNSETTTATPAARDTAARADFSRTISPPLPKPLSPYLAANISSGSTSPHLVMSRNKRTSPPTAKQHRLSTAPRNYAYLSLHAPVSNSARRLRRLVSMSARRFAALPLRPHLAAHKGPPPVAVRFFARGETC